MIWKSEETIPDGTLSKAVMVTLGCDTKASKPVNMHIYRLTGSKLLSFLTPNQVTALRRNELEFLARSYNLSRRRTRNKEADAAEKWDIQKWSPKNKLDIPDRYTKLHLSK